MIQIPGEVALFLVIAVPTFVTLMLVLKLIRIGMGEDE